FFGGYNQWNQGARAEEAVVARVNNEDVSREMYDRALQLNQQRMRMSGSTAPVTPEQEIQMRAAAFDMAENDLLRTQLAKQLGVSVSDSEARAEQKKMINQILAGKLAGSTAEEKRQFEDQVAGQIPLESVKNQLLAQGLEKKI